MVRRLGLADLDGEPSPEMTHYIAKEDLDFGMASPARYRRALEAAGFVGVSRNMVHPPEAIVARNLWSIVAGYFPGALITDRTMLSSSDRRAASGQPCRNFASRSSRRRWIARVSAALA